MSRIETHMHDILHNNLISTQIPLTLKHIKHKHNPNRINNSNNNNRNWNNNRSVIKVRPGASNNQ